MGGCGVGGLWVVVIEVGRLWNVLADISHHSKTEERICGDLFTPSHSVPNRKGEVNMLSGLTKIVRSNISGIKNLCFVISKF